MLGSQFFFWGRSGVHNVMVAHPWIPRPIHCKARWQERQEGLKRSATSHAGEHFFRGSYKDGIICWRSGTLIRVWRTPTQATLARHFAFHLPAATVTWASCQDQMGAAVPTAQDTYLIRKSQKRRPCSQCEVVGPESYCSATVVLGLAFPTVQWHSAVTSAPSGLLVYRINCVPSIAIV